MTQFIALFHSDAEEPINTSSALVSCVGERSWLLFFLLESYGEIVDWMHATGGCE